MISRIKYYAIIILLTATTSSHAANSIPSEFHGKWTSEKSKCKFFEEYGAPDTGAKIDAKSVSYYELGCTLKKVVKQSGSSFTGKFACMGEGDTQMTTISIKKDPSGPLTLNGEPLPVRCK